jgi:hypothetical protein
MMNQRQRTALSRPCFSPQETEWPHFGWRMLAPNDHITCRLTLNVGME